jgi:hypothetical protein
MLGHEHAALGEQILDVSEAEAESLIHPDCADDDLGRETVTADSGLAFAGLPGLPDPALKSRRSAASPANDTGLLFGRPLSFGGEGGIVPGTCLYPRPPGALRATKLAVLANFSNPEPNPMALHHQS